MEKVLHFLTQQFDGAPVWGWILGAAMLHFEYWIARTKKLKAGSTLELVPNILYKLGGRFVPGLRAVLASLGSYKRLAEQEQEPSPPAPPEPPPTPPEAA